MRNEGFIGGKIDPIHGSGSPIAGEPVGAQEKWNVNFARAVHDAKGDGNVQEKRGFSAAGKIRFNLKMDPEGALAIRVRKGESSVGVGHSF
jgi:hypothetical protein